MSNIDSDFRTKAAGAVPSFTERARMATRVLDGPRMKGGAQMARGFPMPGGMQPQPESFANGGMVRGPGTGTSDSVKDAVPPGTYIMPADSTRQIGEQNMACLGFRPGMMQAAQAADPGPRLGFKPKSQREKEGAVPVNLSNGEYKVPPEQVQAIGAQVLDGLKAVTHASAEQQAQEDTGEAAQPERPRDELYFVDGGTVRKPPPVDIAQGLREAVIDPIVSDVRQGNRVLQQEYPLAYQAAQLHPVVGIPSAGLNYADAMQKGDTQGAIAASLSSIPLAEKAYKIGNAIASGAREIVGNRGFRAAANNLGRRFGAGEQTAESFEAGQQQGLQMVKPNGLNFANGGLVGDPNAGIYHPDGRRVDWGGASRASINAPHAPWGDLTHSDGVKMSNIEGYFRDKAKVATGFFNADGAPARGKPGYMGMEVTGPAPQPAAPQPGVAHRAGRAAGVGLDKAKGVGLGGAIGAAGVAAQGIAMDHDGVRSQFYDDPGVSGFDKLRQGARDVKTLALPAAAGIVGGVAGAPAGPAGAIAGGVGSAVLGGAADRYIESGLGASALDAYRSRIAKAGAVTPYKDNSEVIGPGDPRYQQLMDTPNGGIVGQDELPSAKVARTTFKTNQFARQADPEAELARQAGNFNQFEAPINAALADRVKANGGSSFRDGAAQALFNAKQGLNGSGISVSNINGTPTFTGDNRAGGGQLYRAADGSVTNDWSKTQQYADAIQRNAKDQDRLAELTRGAALSGDKEALARLTHGDQRLAGIATEAGTEKNLRDAVKRGSRNAAMVLADMEKSKATQGMAQAELGLKRAAFVGAQEDRDLNRQLRQDSLAARVAENQRAAVKDTRETAQARLTNLDKQFEQYATTDGKLDGQKLARIRGLAANLQPSPGQSPEEFNKDVTTHVGLASKLDGMQAFYDRWFSQAGQGGTDIRQWKPNEGVGRGGFITDQGDHISTSQYNSLTDDEKAIFKKLYLKGGK